MESLSFDKWFKELATLAKERGMPDLIDVSNPYSYMEYFDDGDSPEDCFDSEYDSQELKDYE